MKKTTISVSAHIGEMTKIKLCSRTSAIEFDGWPASLNLFVQLGSGNNGVDAAKWLIEKLQELIESAE